MDLNVAPVTSLQKNSGFIRFLFFAALPQFDQQMSPEHKSCDITLMSSTFLSSKLAAIICQQFTLSLSVTVCSVP